MAKVLRLIPLLAVLGTGGCDSILGGGERELRRVGIIEFHNEPVTVTVPETVTAGVPFQVRVLTYGVGCYTMGGTNVVEVTGGVQILPYDFLRVNGDDPCPQTLQTFDHTAEVTLGSPGTYTVTFQGASIQTTGTTRIRVERSVTAE